MLPQRPTRRRKVSGVAEGGLIASLGCIYMLFILALNLAWIALVVFVVAKILQAMGVF